MPKSAKKSGGSKKIGRATDKCKRYRELGIRERNKKRKQAKQQKRTEFFLKRRISRGCIEEFPVEVEVSDSNE